MRIGKLYLSKKALCVIVALEVILIGLILSVGLMMTAPLQIKLTGEREMILFCGEAFVDPGAEAMVGEKRVDVTVFGDVDTNVAGTYTLTYAAKYQLTESYTTRTVRVVQVTPSVIELLGGEEVTVTVGTAFVEPGFKATDCIGQDVTARVRISGEVDTQRCGEYELVYTVTDRAGNVTTVKRKVIVEPAKQPEVVQPDGKVIYLTFDDGPSAYTQQVLDVLEKYHVKATFFVVHTGRSDEAQLMRGIVEGGHAIGIHSVTHNYSKIYASEEAYLKDLYGMQTIIEEATGVKTTLMRFPGGSSVAAGPEGLMRQLVKTVKERGFQYFDWNVDSKDAGGAKTAEEVYQNTISQIQGKKTAWVLQHDVKKYSVEAVEDIIKWGLANGYTFRALTPESPTWQHRK